ncbi:MAG: RNA polymerase sigma factor SigJ [Actinomycetales bacterium]
MTTDADLAATFTAERARLLNLAYRLLGSWADAEDVVADAWPRWSSSGAQVRNPAAWLTTVVSRLALDLLRSARARRENYVGPWLPEPVLHGLDGHPLPGVTPGQDPALVVELDESVRMAFLVVLHELSPEQRVAFVLHDVLQVPFVTVSEVLGCSLVAARQYASRARARVRAADPPETIAVEPALLLLDQLGAALATGDARGLARLLAPDVVMVSDGGGDVFAARRPMLGAEVSRFLLGLGTRMSTPELTVDQVLVNGQPGVLMRSPQAQTGQPAVGVYSFAVRDGLIVGVHAVLAPAKVDRYAG